MLSSREVAMVLLPHVGSASLVPVRVPRGRHLCGNILRRVATCLFVVVINVPAIISTNVTGLASVEKRRGCQFWTHMGCLLDSLEKLCTGTEAHDLLMPSSYESVWMCCCPQPYQACDEIAFDHDCRSALSTFVGPLFSFPGDLAAALQRARGELRAIGGKPCEVLAPEEPLSRCGNEPNPPLDRSLERGDLFCEAVTWQLEELGDGVVEEFRQNGCKANFTLRAVDGEQRKGQRLPWVWWDESLDLAGYVAASGNIVSEAAVDMEVDALYETMRLHNSTDAWNVYAQGSGVIVGSGHGVGDSLRSVWTTNSDETANKLFEAYFDANYVDNFISAAIYGLQEFQGLNLEGRMAAVVAGSVQQGLVMRIFHELGMSIKSCNVAKTNGDGQNELNRATAHWDRAWGYFVGRMRSPLPERLLYGLGDELCPMFGTCDSTKLSDAIFHPKSRVNREMLDLFYQGLQQLRDFGGDGCFNSLLLKEAIGRKMLVPLFQDLIRLAYASDPKAGVRKSSDEIANFTNATAAAAARGWATARAVLPWLARCSEVAAEAVERNMRIVTDVEGRIPDGYVAVKQAIEKAYICLGVRCADIGGVLVPGSTNVYVKGLEPCIGSYYVYREPGEQELEQPFGVIFESSPGSTYGSNAKREIWLVILWLLAGAALAVASLGACLFVHFSCKQLRSGRPDNETSSLVDNQVYGNSQPAAPPRHAATPPGHEAPPLHDYSQPVSPPVLAASYADDSPAV
eukprot:TRINITY_DN33635_c0_g1_i1.p1 TRINITY_DN33635_c0_g1~~TRINITY_DN33635_c0_g1_i1.p1  ORF type:complete len:742 (-),score=84.95 TRINITY_DN33635_c0_g1_i1:78-2303(-)